MCSVAPTPLPPSEGVLLSCGGGQPEVMRSGPPSLAVPTNAVLTAEGPVWGCSHLPPLFVCTSLAFLGSPKLRLGQVSRNTPGGRG